MAEQDYEKDFPDLKKIGYLLTSDPADYNCIAFAAWDEDRWWWPSGKEDEYWPLPIPDQINLQSFIDAFSTKGYSRADNGQPEAGFRKIAIYGKENGEVAHAARLENGEIKWRSKLGPQEDIEHTLEGLEGKCYGRVIAFMKKPVGSSIG